MFGEDPVVEMIWMSPSMPTRMRVSALAIGSLLPASSSSVGARFSFSLMRLPLRMLKTEAESVDDMTEAIRRQTRMVDMVEPTMVYPYTTKMNAAVMMTVSNTPRVDRSTPCFMTGRTFFRSVSRPPVRRMMVIASSPI